MKSKSFKKATIDSRISTFITLCILCLFFVNSSYILEFITGISYTTVSAILKIIIGAFFILTLPSIVSRFNVRIIVLSSSLALLFLLNLIFFPNLKEFFLETLISFWTICYILMLSICCIRDYDMLLKKIEKVSFVVAIFAALFVAVRLLNYNETRAFYSIGFGYSCLLPAILVFMSFFKKPSFFSLICFSFLLLAILLIGSRGPLLSLFLFIFFYLLILVLGTILNHNQYKLSRKLFIILSFTFVLIFTLFYRQFFTFLSDVLVKLGVPNRTLSLLLSDPLHDSGRFDLQSKIIESIISSPFDVRGINSDYSLIGIYSHNLILELIYQFGLLFGGAAILLVALLLLKLILRLNYSSFHSLMLALAFASIPSLMVNGSLWTNEMFWMWFGLAMMNFSKVNYAKESIYARKDNFIVERSKNDVFIQKNS